jgi:hypothetical protein
LGVIRARCSLRRFSRQLKTGAGLFFIPDSSPRMKLK